MVFTQTGVDLCQVLFVDDLVFVLVDHVEGLFELLDLLLVEHGEDIRGLPLRAAAAALALSSRDCVGGHFVLFIGFVR